MESGELLGSGSGERSRVSSDMDLCSDVSEQEKGEKGDRSELVRVTTRGQVRSSGLTDKAK